MSKSVASPTGRVEGVGAKRTTVGLYLDLLRPFVLSPSLPSRVARPGAAVAVGTWNPPGCPSGLREAAGDSLIMEANMYKPPKPKRREVRRPATVLARPSCTDRTSLPPCHWHRTPQLVQEAKRLRLENGDLRGHNAHLQEDNTRLVHKQNELLLTMSTLQDAHMKLQEARIWQLESGQAAVVARPAAPAAPATPAAAPRASAEGGAWLWSLVAP